jgi:hypothetical protein
MKKMPCLFVREFHGREFTITREVTPGCEWVLVGEGVASRKWDGTACAVIDGVLYKRFDAKRGKTPPKCAVPCEPEPDPVTGHWPHWVPVDPTNQADKHHFAAWWALVDPSDGDQWRPLSNGTYELIGPPINGNAEGAVTLQFHRHGDIALDVPRDFDGLCAYLTEHVIEGIVFAHPDGRFAKIRRDDLGLPWGRKKS